VNRPERNEIIFPAGFLQPPFYSVTRDAAVNYGGIGAVIGHEVTHGFDDVGRRLDGQGNWRNWWTAVDAKAFEERAACMVDQYSQYAVADGTKVNGRLTLGENIADNGGLRLALMAYLAGPGVGAEIVDGFTPTQRFFVSWAQAWCVNVRPEAERLQIATDPHSPNRYRVNGPLSNMPEFARAFSCKSDAPMVRQNACRVW
jgi:endothelin-converting enzyme/putative endopeptidase